MDFAESVSLDRTLGMVKNQDLALCTIMCVTLSYCRMEMGLDDYRVDAFVDESGYEFDAHGA
jgi:hypothetical protein